MAFSLLLLCICGCGTVPRRTPNTSAPPPQEQPPLPQAGAFYTPGLDAFASSTGLQKTELDRRVNVFLRRTLPSVPALECFAREYAARFAADGVDPAPRVVQLLAQHCGYWSKAVQQFSVTGSDYLDVERALAMLPENVTQGPLAVGTVAHPDGKVTVSVLVPPQILRLNPLPRTGLTRLSGEAMIGDGELEFWVLEQPRGMAQKLDAVIDQKGVFELRFTRPLQPHRLEITRLRGPIRETIALFHLGARPAQYESNKHPISGPSAPVDEASMIEAFNERRQALGLQPLKPHVHLQSALQHWLQQLAGQKGVGLPTGMLDERGMKYPVMDFGFTHGRTAADAVDMLNDSPTGQALLNNKRFSHFAVGRRPFSEGPGADFVIALLEPFELINTDLARARILKRINAIREKSKLPPLEYAESLSEAAQVAIKQVMAGHLEWQGALDAVSATIKKQRLANGLFGLAGLSASKLADLNINAETIVRHPSVKHLGIAVLGGPLPGQGTPRYLCVLIVSEGLAQASR
ncbi:MAG: hypothetical protein ACON3Z_10165 [Bradymonadia bacterium]